MLSTGASQRRMNQPDGLNTDPWWSPDGRQLVFTSAPRETPADTDMLATYRKTFGMGTMKSATPAEAVTKAIPVIDGIDQAKAAKGMLVADGNVLPW